MSPPLRTSAAVPICNGLERHRLVAAGAAAVDLGKATCWQTSGMFGRPTNARDEARASAAALPEMRAANATDPANRAVRRIARAFYV